MQLQLQRKSQSKILDLNTLTLTVLCGCKINSDNNSDEISTFEPITEENLNKNS